MDFILGGVSDLLNTMSAALGGWTFARDLASDFAKMQPYLRKANAIIPINDALTVLGLYAGVQLALVAYYWITRAINLLRGAG